VIVFLFNCENQHLMMFISNWFFDVPIGTAGDCYDCYCICIEEMRQSIQTLLQMWFIFIFPLVNIAQTIPSC